MTNDDSGARSPGADYSALAGGLLEGDGGARQFAVARSVNGNPVQRLSDAERRQRECFYNLCTMHEIMKMCDE